MQWTPLCFSRHRTKIKQRSGTFFGAMADRFLSNGLGVNSDGSAPLLLPETMQIARPPFGATESGFANDKS
jgi:hypothetical protein